MNDLWIQAGGEKKQGAEIGKGGLAGQCSSHIIQGNCEVSRPRRGLSKHEKGSSYITLPTADNYEMTKGLI